MPKHHLLSRPLAVSVAMSALIGACTAAKDKLPNPVHAPHQLVMHPVGERAGTHVGLDHVTPLHTHSLSTGSDHVDPSIFSSRSRSSAARPIIRVVVN